MKIYFVVGHPWTPKYEIVRFDEKTNLLIPIEATFADSHSAKLFAQMMNERENNQQ